MIIKTEPVIPGVLVFLGAVNAPRRWSWHEWFPAARTLAILDMGTWLVQDRLFKDILDTVSKSDQANTFL